MPSHIRVSLLDHESSQQKPSGAAENGNDGFQILKENNSLPRLSSKPIRNEGEIRPSKKSKNLGN